MRAVRRSGGHDHAYAAPVLRWYARTPATCRGVQPGAVALGGPGQRGHAAADAGGPGAARARGLAGALADARRAGRGHPGRRGPAVGPAGLPAPGGPAARERAAHGRASTTARSLTRSRTCARCPASAPTPRPPWPASPSASGTRCSTPTCGGCWPGSCPARRLPPAAQSAAEVALAESLLPADGREAARWSVAVMELGALVCTAARPDCSRCPVAGQCAWRRRGPPGCPAARAAPALRRAPTGSAGARCWRCCGPPADPVPAAALDAAWPTTSGSRALVACRRRPDRPTRLVALPAARTDAAAPCPVDWAGDLARLPRGRLPSGAVALAPVRLGTRRMSGDRRRVRHRLRLGIAAEGELGLLARRPRRPR